MAYPNSLFIQVQTTISSCYRLTWDVLETTNQYPCAGRGVAAQTPNQNPFSFVATSINQLMPEKNITNL